MTTESVSWTDEARAAVLPRRDQPETHREHRFEYPPEGMTPFEATRRALTDRRQKWEAGYEVSGKLAALMKQGLEHFLQDGPIDVDSQAVTQTTLTYSWNPAHELMSAYWLEAQGAAFALAALLRTYDFCGDGSFRDPEAYFCYEAADASQHKRPWETNRLHEQAVTESRQSWMLLRCALATAAEDDYRAALAVAERALANARTPLPVRCAIAFAFPTEAQWATACAEECIAQKEPKDEYYNWYVGALLASLADAKVATRLARIVRHHHTSEQACSLVANLGAEAVGALEQLVPGSGAVSALTCIASIPAARALVPLVGHKAHRDEVAAYFDRHPEIALRALAPLAGDSRSKLQAKALAALTTVASAHPQELEATTPELSESAQQVLRSLKGPSADDLASPEEIPPILVTPPWLTKASVKKAPAIPDLARLPYEARLSWEDDEEAEWLTKRGPDFWDAELAGYGRADWEAAFEDAEFSRRLTWDSRCVQAMFCDGPTDLALARWQRMTDEELSPGRGGIHGVSDFLYRAVARHGLGMLEPLLRLVEFQKRNDPAQVIGVLLPFDAVGVAPLMAEALTGKKARSVSEVWLRRHPETAALGLIPLAVAPLAKKDKIQVGSLQALGFLVASGHGDIVRAVGERYAEASGADVIGRLEAVVGLDPLAYRPPKLPRLPDFWQPVGWPRPALESGKLLPDETLDHLGTMLAFSPLDPPYAGIALVKQAATGESLREFAWALFSAWMAAGADPKQIWAFHALAHFGDDEIARRLTPLIRAWPGESANARALVGLQILAAIGTDVALMHLNGIAEKVKFKSIKENAGLLIKKVARELGLSHEQLGDRLVPDLGLEPDGSLILDYGPRSFRVGFDEALVPSVIDEDGKRRKALPKPGKTDGAVAAESQKRWKALKKDAKAVARLQVQRLERAMCSRRRWSSEELRMFFIDHPLVFHLARRLIWGAYETGSNRLLSTFRVAEDRTLTDEEDSLWELPDSARAGIVHPLELDEATGRRWGELLSDYEILQPFPQLGREVYRLEHPEPDSITTFSGIELPAPKLVFGLEKLGWRRYAASDGGAFWGHYREFSDLGLAACVEYEGAVGMGYIEETETLTIQKLHFVELPKDTPIPVAEVDAIAVSEALRDLYQLTQS